MLAYSTVSQLVHDVFPGARRMGRRPLPLFTMPASGPAVPLLGSGIHALPYERETEMGGCGRRCPGPRGRCVGCLAISGGHPADRLSGYHSKDAIWPGRSPSPGAAHASCSTSPPRGRSRRLRVSLWFMTFSGKPRVEQVCDHTVAGGDDRSPGDPGGTCDQRPAGPSRSRLGTTGIARTRPGRWARRGFPERGRSPAWWFPRSTTPTRRRCTRSSRWPPSPRRWRVS